MMRGEARGVGFVERGIDFVQDAEGGGLGFEDGHDQGDGGHGFFAAGEQRHATAAPCPAGGR